MKTVCLHGRVSSNLTPSAIGGFMPPSFLVIICALLAMISGISGDMVALIFSFYTIILEVNNQMNTNILTAVNGACGVASNDMKYL